MLSIFKTPHLSLLAMLLITGCTASDLKAPPAAVPSVEIQASKPVVASRVVALTSLSADILHRLDRTKLVGIPGSRLLRQNPELSQITEVSAGQTPPSLEKIVALKPDLVVGAVGFHDSILTKLQGLGIKTLTTQVTDWQSLQKLTRQLATAIQADPDPLLKSYQSFLATSPANLGSTLVLVSYQPILAPNKTSWAGDLLNQFKIENLAADLQGQGPQQGYITLSPEKVLQANPEILILVDVGDGTIDQLKAAPFWRQLKAVANDRVYVFDYYGLVNPGSIASIEKTCQQLKKILGDQSRLKK